MVVNSTLSFRRAKRGEILSTLGKGFLPSAEMTRIERSAEGHNYYIYILTNWNNNVMYIGVTNNL